MLYIDKICGYYAEFRIIRFLVFFMVVFILHIFLGNSLYCVNGKIKKGLKQRIKQFPIIMNVTNIKKFIYNLSF